MTDEGDRPAPPRPGEGGGETDSWRDLGRRLPSTTPPDDPAAVLDRRIKGARVLVIDDDPSKLDAVAVALRALGLSISVGDRGESGYRQALRIKPDAVVSDLVSPGEAGWWLVQRLRRHPLLKWTPVLLMRLTEKAPDGGDHVLTQRIAERLGDAFGPIHVLAERIAVGRGLTDRVEAIGVPRLLRVLSGAVLDGKLAINDSWNVFEVVLRAGEVMSAVRRGMDGEEDAGETAFMQLLLCDAGRWSFRPLTTHGLPVNLAPSLEENLERATRTLASLFGPEATITASSDAEIEVRMDLLRSAAPAVAAEYGRVVRAILEHAPAAALVELLREPDDVALAERALVSLIRCGAVVPAAGKNKGERNPAEAGAARNAAWLLAEVAADHRAFGRAPTETLPAESLPKAAPARSGGAYIMSEVRAERVPAKVLEGIKLPTESLVESRTEPERDTEPRRREDSPVVVNAAKEARAAREDATPEVRPIHPKDTLAPAPPPKDRKNVQTWIAIALTVALAAAVVGALVMLGSGNRLAPPSAPPSSEGP
ncbi:MAG: hypothetical protein PHU25_00080 [Deltaproteobacteria bacterium]|nr:hypothetical protein [Deltaproteobacteria bacterium]